MFRLSWKDLAPFCTASKNFESCSWVKELVSSPNFLALSRASWASFFSFCNKIEKGVWEKLLVAQRIVIYLDVFIVKRILDGIQALLEEIGEFRLRLLGGNASGLGDLSEGEVTRLSLELDHILRELTATSAKSMQIKAILAILLDCFGFCLGLGWSSTRFCTALSTDQTAEIELKTKPRFALFHSISLLSLSMWIQLGNDSNNSQISWA